MSICNIILRVTISICVLSKVICISENEDSYKLKPIVKGDKYTDSAFSQPLENSEFMNGSKTQQDIKISSNNVLAFDARGHKIHPKMKASYNIPTFDNGYESKGSYKIEPPITDKTYPYNVPNFTDTDGDKKEKHQPSTSELVSRILAALDKVIDYYEKNYEVMNFDGIFGAKVIEGQLNLVVAKYKKGFLSEIIDDYMKKDIAKMASRAGHVVKQAIPQLTQRFPKQMKRLRRLLQLSWDMGHSHRSVDISQLWSDHTRLLTHPEPFNEIESDSCMSELLEEVNGLSCSMTQACQYLMTQPGRDKYALTHQILYTVVAEMSGCGSRLEMWLVRHKRSGSVEQLQEELCTNLHIELVTLAAAMFQHNNMAFRDLFLEMEFVCGMLGYIDFLDRDWLLNILGWQSASGCYPASRPHFTIGRKLLEEERLADGCLSHLTSVASSALCVHLHYLLYPHPAILNTLPSRNLLPPKAALPLPVTRGAVIGAEPLFRGDVLPRIGKTGGAELGAGPRRGDLPPEMDGLAIQEKSLEDKADLVLQHLEEKKHLEKDTSQFKNHLDQMPFTPAVFGRVRDQKSIFAQQNNALRLVMGQKQNIYKHKNALRSVMEENQSLLSVDYLASTQMANTQDQWLNPLLLVVSSVVLVSVVMLRYVHAKRRAHTLFRNRFRL